MAAAIALAMSGPKSSPAKRLPLSSRPIKKQTVRARVDANGV